MKYLVFIIAIITFISCKNNSTTNTIPKEILNQKLIGLVIKDKNETEISKKYWVDFSAACMCDSPSMYIDEKSNKLIIFNYCDNGTPPNNLEKAFEFKIYKSENIDTSIIIYCKNKKNENLILEFKKMLNSKIYNLKVKGEFPKEYIGNTWNEYFISKPNLNNIKIEDCGDFDG